MLVLPQLVVLLLLYVTLKKPTYQTHFKSIVALIIHSFFFTKKEAKTWGRQPRRKLKKKDLGFMVSKKEQHFKRLSEEHNQRAWGPHGPRGAPR